MDNASSILLAIDAATECPSLALFSAGVLIAEKLIDLPGRKHSATLLPGVERLLGSRGMDVGALDAVAVTRGPGSFTSVRIGLATACGLAYARRLPVYALNTLEVLAAEGRRQIGPFSWLLPMLDARKGEVYAALYPPGENLADPFSGPIVEKAENVLDAALGHSGAAEISVFGSGAIALWSGQDSRRDGFGKPSLEMTERPNAVALGERVIWRLSEGLGCESPIPLYLRRPEALRRLEKDADR